MSTDPDIARLRLELERLTRERDAIALMWFRELADTAPGEERLYDLVGPSIYTGVDDAGAIGAARRAAGLDREEARTMTPDRIVAWRVTARGYPDAGVYAAATPAQAMTMALMAAHDVGYMIAWEDLTAERAPEFDAWIAGQAPGRGWDEAYARRCMDQNAQEWPQDAPGSISEG